MKLFLDENMPAKAVEPLRALFGARHEFETAHSLDVTGVDDVDLYPRVRAAGILAIVSKDERQLRNDVERRGLFDNGLSFIHLQMKNVAGLKGLALTVASLTAGIPYVEERWAPEPHAFRLKGMQTGVHRTRQFASPALARQVGRTTDLIAQRIGMEVQNSYEHLNCSRRDYRARFARSTSRIRTRRHRELRQAVGFLLLLALPSFLDDLGSMLPSLAPPIH
ncbi:MAG: hypothetical protein QM604_05100 [Microbacterium sp.]